MDRARAAAQASASVTPAPKRKRAVGRSRATWSRSATRPSQITRFEVAQLLGDPKADVGRPGDERGIGKSLVERGEPLQAGGGGEKGRLVADEEIGIVVQASERLAARLRRRGETVVRRRVAGCERRLEDRPVASAAAEVAGELIAEARPGRGGAGVVGGEQAHDDAGRAKAALRPVMVDHRLLHRVKLLAVRQVFDRDQLGAVELPEQQNAGVKRVVGEASGAVARQNDRAGPAVALGATLLRALGARALAQPVEHGRPRRKPVERNQVSPEPEAKRVTKPSRIVVLFHRRSSRPAV